MKNYGLLFLISLLYGVLSAQSANPPAPGFNAAASDQKAIEIADATMEAMGGRTAWDETRFIRWTFFGSRTLLWDKWTGRVRIDFPEEGQVMLVNIHSGEGKVWKEGAYLTNADSIQQDLRRAKSIWINDSYWLVMPYKLKDSGVTLKYLGTQGAADSLQHQLQLTFEEVGDTPENKYWVMVNDNSKLVTSWSFFPQFNDDSPRFTTPWADYEQHGAVLLSGNRGRGQLTDIGVFEAVPDAVFEDAKAYNPLDWQ